MCCWELVDFLVQAGRLISVDHLGVGCLGIGVKFLNCCLRLNGGRAASGSCAPMTEGSFQEYEALQGIDLAFLRVEVCFSATKGMDSEP